MASASAQDLDSRRAGRVGVPGLRLARIPVGGSARFLQTGSPAHRPALRRIRGSPKSGKTLLSVKRVMAEILSP
jgi:hypothetical protein